MLGEMSSAKDENLGQDGTDDSSIKPVSSLRSQFESLTAVKGVQNKPLTSAPSSRKSSVALDTKEPVDQIRSASSSRPSLDVPTSGPSRSSPETSDNERKAPPLPAPRRRGISPSPSAQSLTTNVERDGAVLAPPRVDVISPRSPPRSITIPRDMPSFPHAQGPLTPTPLRPASPFATSGHFRIPSREIEPRSSPSLHNPDLPTTVSDPAKVLPETEVDPKKSSGIGKMGPPPPPPFNRSAKPKIGIGKNDASNVLLPHVVEQPSEVSPFSSPPSSGDELQSPGTPPPVPEQSKPKPSHAFNSREPGLEHSPGSQIRSASHGGSNSPRSHDYRSISQPVKSFASSQSITQDSYETKPMLPPRRENTATLANRAMLSQTESPIRRSLDAPAKSSALTQGFGSSPSASKSRAGQPQAALAAHGDGSNRPSAADKAAHSARQQVDRGFIDSDRQQGNASAVAALRNPTPPPRLQIGTQRAPSPLHQPGSALTYDSESGETVSDSIHVTEYPDFSQTNRRPPYLHDGPRTISTGIESKLFSVCGEYVCITSVLTRVWDLLTGKLLLSMSHGENVKATALAFKPAKRVEDEGKRLWLGTNWGELLEVDIPNKKIVASNNNAHTRREVIKIYRLGANLWTLDDDGKLFVWPSDGDESPNLGNGIPNPRLPRGQTSSLIVGKQLWMAFGKEIKIFEPSTHPDTNIHVLTRSIAHPAAGEVSSSAILPGQLDRVYFGDKEGKVSVYSRKDYTCLAIFNVSNYRITSMVGIGEYLWVGYGTGKLCVYDTTKTPWRVKKSWQAHGTVSALIADRSSIWKLNRFQVLSLGNNTIGIWDGMLKSDWLNEEMLALEADYCTFHNLTSAVVTWNAGASRPMDLRYDQKDSNFFREALYAEEAPDILVIGLQELVDLEDKKLTAKSFFKSKTKDPYGHEHLSSVYRDWRDSLSRFIDEIMPVSENYTLLQTGNLVGLFTCIFVKTAHRQRIRDAQVTEIKTGMGGLHGNKGALIIRFIFDDSSLCFINCHLAAGQTKTTDRNNDVASILEAAPLPPHERSLSSQTIFVGGGDGSMIMDHEICILNGDLNYRIETLPRDSIISAVKSKNFAKLLDRDQLLLSKRKVPSFQLRAFKEAPITFAPTYKYDVGTDNYDSSEKRRSPAWCDRILYRGPGRIKQLDYSRHNLYMSDHRPVSAFFQLKIKSVQGDQREAAWQRCMAKYEQVKMGVSTNARLDYLTNTFGLDLNEAKRLLA